MRYPDLPFRAPRHWRSGRRDGVRPRLIVVHYTAGSERSTSAEDGASYDQRRTDSVSTHYFVDQDSIVQCVDTADTAYAAMSHGNQWGIQYELCGTVQTRAGWLDAASRATIRRAAGQIARDLRTHGIPLRRLVGRQVRDGSGICGHVDCTDGWAEDGGTHRDPGAEFPWDVLLADTQAALAGHTDPTQEDPDMDGSTVVPYYDSTPPAGKPVAQNVTYNSWLGSVSSLVNGTADRVVTIGAAVDGLVRAVSGIATSVASLAGKVDAVSQRVAALEARPAVEAPDVDEDAIAHRVVVELVGTVTTPTS